MSFQAISWVLSQEVSKSTDKFVLLCLANYADESGFCYPSVERLCQDTSQDRKTVMKCLSSLKETGLLTDTGRRVGSTKSVPIYQIEGLPEASQYHYVYKLIEPETGRYYYGKRSSNCEPEMDTYRGSGKWPKAMAASGTFLHRQVISVFETSVEALSAETSILRGIGDDALCMNTERPYEKRKQYHISQAVPNFPDKQSQISHVSSTKNGTENLSPEPISKPIKEDDVIFSELSKVLSEGVAKEVIQYRKGLKAKLTPYAAELLAKKFKLWPNPDEAANHMIVSGWRGFEVAWMEKSKPAKSSATQYADKHGNLPGDPYYGVDY